MDVSKSPTRKKRGRAPAASSDAGSTQIQSLSRGLTLLERLAAAEGGVGLVDLAQRVGLPPSTTYRLLGTMEKMGYVYQAGELGLWYVGLKAFVVGSAFLENRDLVAQSHHFLRRLMEQSGETANLAVPDDYEAVFVDQVQCREMMRMIVKLGSRVPLHASGVGKALLAAMSDDRVNDTLHQKGLARITPNTIHTPAKLWSELQNIRRQGFSYDDEEHALGLRCLAAAIYDQFGEPIAAISIAGPKPRVPDERVMELGVLVARTAKAITESMGGRMPERPDKQAA